MIMTIEMVTKFAYKVTEHETFIGKLIKRKWFTQDLQGKTEEFYL